MEDFIDYYELLQISPNAEPQTIQRVYRMLAARYHPDTRRPAIASASCCSSRPTRSSPTRSGERLTTPVIKPIGFNRFPFSR